MLINQLGLDPDRPIADAYRHYKNCKWAVIEFKGRSHLKRAREQLESTVQQLRQKGRPVEYAIVVMEKLRPPESKIYGRDDRTHEVYFRAATNRRVKIDNIPLLLYFTREVREVEERNRLWEFT